jgi:hypothetical protein
MSAPTFRDKNVLSILDVGSSRDSDLDPAKEARRIANEVFSGYHEGAFQLPSDVRREELMIKPRCN